MKVGEHLVGEDRGKAISDIRNKRRQRERKMLDVFGEHEPFRNEVQCMKVNTELKLITTNTSNVL